MKRAIVIAICFVVVFGVMGGVFLAYTYHKEAVEYDDLITKFSYVDNKGVFRGEFSTERSGMLLCDYDYEIKGSTLYITLYQTAGERNTLKLDENDYARIEIPDCKGVKKLYYRCNGEEDKINLAK